MDTVGQCSVTLRRQRPGHSFLRQESEETVSPSLEAISRMFVVGRGTLEQHDRRLMLRRQRLQESCGPLLRRTVPIAIMLQRLYTLGK